VETFAWIVGVAVTIGIGLLVNSLLGGFVQMVTRIVRLVRIRTSRVYSFGLNQSTHSDTAPSEDDLLVSFGHIPWRSLYLLSALAGMGLFALLSPQIPGAALAFLALPGLVYLLRRYLIYNWRRFLAAQVRELLVDARLGMSLYGSLLLGLENIAATTVETSAVYRVLKRQFAGGSPKSGLDVLQAMGVELKAPELERTVSRLRSAQAAGGVLDLDAALGNAIDEITEEINSGAEEQMQKLPLRITLLAMPFLLGPIIILLFYPLVAKVLGTLSGMPTAGGF
jgi:hypothetical protein